MIAGIMAQQMHQAGGAPTSSNLIVNPSGDDGIFGWNAELGTYFTTQVGDVEPGLNNFFFGAPGMGDRALRQKQTMDIPSEILAQMGEAEVSVSLDYRTGLGASEVDFGAVVIRFHSEFGGGGAILSLSWSDDLISTTGKATYAFTTLAPAGTKSITLAMICRHVDGINADLYFRNVSVTITPSSLKCLPIFAWDTPTEAGWTVTAGIITGSTTSTTSSEFSGIFAVPSAWGGSQANLAYHRDIALNPAALAVVSTGNAIARLNLLNWRNNSSDRSRSYVQFLGSGDAVLGVVEDAPSPYSWPRAPTRQRHTAAVPVGTVKFRVGHQFARSDGAVSDAIVAQFSACLESAT